MPEHEAQQSERSSVIPVRSTTLMGCLLLIVATCAAYWQVGGHQFYILENPQVREGLTGDGIRWAFTSTDASNWHPLTWLSHMLDVQLFGLDPGARHLVNVALHAVNAVLPGAQGKLEESIEHFQEALRIRPHHAEGQYGMGIALMRRGDIDASIRHFTEALRLKTDVPEARLSLTEAMHLKEGSR